MRHAPQAVLRLAAFSFLAAAFCCPLRIDAQMIVTNAAASPAGSQRSLPPPSPLPRLLVKFRKPMARELEGGLSLPELELQRPSAHARAWLARHQVQALRALYPEALKQKLQLRRSDQQMADDVRARFPQRARRASGATVSPGILRTYAVEAPARSLMEWRSALERLREDPDVEFAQLDQVAQAQLAANDPYFVSSGTWGQWFDDLYGVKIISCPAAWDKANGSGVTVAVIDTGIDYRHRDITNRVWINTSEIPNNGVDDDDNGFVDDQRGWDFIGRSYANPQPDNDPADSVNGHGTHVAGTIAAQGNNNRGIIGVAWGARVMAVRALDDAGYGADSTLANAIRYAADNGADVINASWGGKGTSPVIEDAINYAASLGVVFVAAAGNSTTGNHHGDVENFYPANVAAAIAVSAFTPSDGIAEFSNIGYGLDVAAPGVDVLSLRAANTLLGFAVNDEYARADGTSMAAPHVAGTAALILSLHSSYAPEEVRQVLRCSADRLMAGSFDPYSGYGRINASNALASAPVLQTRILNPARNSIATPQVGITGIATGPNFTRYTLDYGFGYQPSAWTVLAQGGSRVDRGTLGTLPTFGLPDGLYTLRLRAFNNAGAVFEDRRQIVVDYTFITTPDRPAVPSLAAVHKPGAIVGISGTACAPNFQALRVEWARGFDTDAGWSSTGVTLAGGGTSPITNGLLASWDSGVVTQADYYTLRLVMTTPAFSNEAHAIVYLEPDLYSTNWPRWLDQAPPYSSSVQLVRDGAGNNILTLVNGDYLSSPLPSRLWRFPIDGSSVTTSALDNSYLQPAAANLDGIPGDEIVVAERNNIRVFHPDGSSFVPLQPLASKFQFALPTLADLDGDGTPEILAWGSVSSGMRAWIHAWKGDGQLFGGNYPIGPLPDYGVIPPNRFLSVDLDADEKPELLVVVGDSSSSFSLRAFRANGEPADWPTQTFDGTFWQMAAGDLDGDSRPEIVLARSDPGGTSWLHTFSADYSPRAGWPVQLQGGTPLRVIVADLDRDGRNELIVAANATLDVLRADGSHFPGLWPVIGTGFEPLGSPVTGDIDGDGAAEILTTRDNVIFSGELSYRSPNLLAYRMDGQVARSWRLLGANGNQPHGDGDVVFGDFDHDGNADLAVNYMLVSGGGSSGFLEQGVLTVLRLDVPCRPHPRDWPMNFHDARNSAAGLIPAKLRITATRSGLVVTWPHQPEPAVLQGNDDLKSAPWEVLAAGGVCSNGLNTVTLQSTNTRRWYRLQYP